jgi:Rrf2 family protein
MQITRQADYAMRAVAYLANLGPEQRAATSQIAEEQQIPPSFLAKIVSQLSVAGLLQTSRGARGGVSLARTPKKYLFSRLSKRSMGQYCSTSVSSIIQPAILGNPAPCARFSVMRRLI